MQGGQESVFPIGTVYHGFDDRALGGGNWGQGPARVLEPQDGKVFEKTSQNIIQNWSRIPWTIAVTWDDWHEGTEMEPSLQYGFKRFFDLMRFAAEYKGVRPQPSLVLDLTEKLMQQKDGTISQEGKTILTTARGQIPQLESDIEKGIQRYQERTGDTGDQTDVGTTTKNAPTYLRIIFIALAPLLAILGLISFLVMRSRFNRRVRSVYNALMPGEEYTVNEIAQKAGITQKQAQSVMEYLVSSKAGDRGYTGVEAKVDQARGLVYSKSDAHPYKAQAGFVNSAVLLLSGITILGLSIFASLFGLTDPVSIALTIAGTGLLPAGYMTWGAVRFYSIARAVQNAKLEIGLEAYYNKNLYQNTYKKDFADFRRIALYSTWVQSIPAADMRSMRKEARNAAIAWSDGKVDEKAMGILTRDNNRAAYLVKYHETFQTEVRGQLALLPGIETLLRLVNRRQLTDIQHSRVISQTRSPFYSSDGNQLAVNRIQALPVAQRIDLKQLPIGTLLFFVDEGDRGMYTVRVEQNQQVSIWENSYQGQAMTPISELGSGKTYPAEQGRKSGILERGVRADWIRFDHSSAKSNAKIRSLGVRASVGLQPGKMYVQLPMDRDSSSSYGITFMSQDQAREVGVAEEGSRMPAEAVSAEVQERNIVREMERLKNLLPASLNKPLRGIRSLPVRIMQYGLRSVLFASDRSTSGNVGLRLPLRAVASVVLVAFALVQGVVGVFASTRGQAPVMIDDLNPRFEAIKRNLVLPDNVMSKQFNVKQIRFRSLSEQGGFFARLFTGRLLGAYTENVDKFNHGEWATVYVPNRLLRSMSQDMPVADGTLRTRLAIAQYRLNAFLFGEIVSYQSQKYFTETRWDSVAETFGLRSYDVEQATEGETANNVLAGEMTTQAWHKTQRQKLGVSPTEIMSLVNRALAEANSALDLKADRSLQSAWLQVKNNHDQGAEPSIREMLNALAQVGIARAGSQAAALASLARESAAFEGDVQKLVANSIVAQMMEQVTVAQGAENRGIATTAPVSDQEVYLMSLPGTVEQQLLGIQAAIEALQAAGIGQGLLQRLQMLEKVLRAASSKEAGEFGLLEANLGQQLRAEVEHQSGMSKSQMQMQTLGEDLTRTVHLVQTDKVTTTEVEGIQLANPVVYEVFEQLAVDGKAVETKITAQDLAAETLPLHVTALPYRGQRVTVLQAPRARGSFLLSLMRFFRTRQVHRAAMDENPMGYLNTILGLVSVEQSRLQDIMSSDQSPIVQAYLRFVNNPKRTTERDLVKAMVRAIKAEARAVETDSQQAALEASIAAFGEVSQAMRALTPSKSIGVWTRAASKSLANRAIQAPGVLFETGSKGVMGALYDILKAPRMPARVDENALEMQRRRHFRSVNVAA
jgi:hypothetical protein